MFLFCFVWGFKPQSTLLWSCWDGQLTYQHFAWLKFFVHIHVLSLVIDNNPSWITVENISWSNSTKVGPGRDQTCDPWICSWTGIATDCARGPVMVWLQNKNPIVKWCIIYFMVVPQNLPSRSEFLHMEGTRLKKSFEQKKPCEQVVARIFLSILLCDIHALIALWHLQICTLLGINDIPISCKWPQYTFFTGNKRAPAKVKTGLKCVLPSI